MLTKQQIIKIIRQIYRRREPLNITAVKRLHPKLIQAVYAVKPFWGWKRALEDAGIDYRTIKIELLDDCQCALCGKFYRNLSLHIIGKHQAGCDEYLMDYPESDLHSEQLRAQKMGSTKLLIRHWEPIWSREYILDRIAEYHRQGISVTSLNMQNLDDTLHKAANRFCGSWRKALRTIGINPNELTRQIYDKRYHYLDKQDVIKGIKDRHRKGWLLCYNALIGLQKQRHRDPALATRGVELFGTWGKALRAAGIDPGPIQKPGIKRLKYPSAKKVLQEIRSRIKRKWAINSRALYIGPYPDVALVELGNIYFGSWRAALRAAGINSRKLYLEMKRQRRRYPDKKAVLAAMAKRIKAGRYMNFAETWKGKYRDPSLVTNAREYFGSWDKALKKAGLDPNSIKWHARDRGAKKLRRAYRNR